MRDKLVAFFDGVVEWCLYFLIFFLPFTKGGMSVVTVLAILMWTAKRAVGFRADGFKGLIPKTPLNKALLIFLASQILSVVFSRHFDASLQALFTKTIKFSIIFLMMVETLNTEKRIGKMVKAITASAVLISADAVVQFVHGMDFLRKIPFDRLTASFSNPNGFSGWLVVIILFFLGTAWSQGRRSFNWKLIVWSVPLILMLMGCLLVTASRGGWLGFLSAAIVFFFCFVLYLERRQRLWLFAGSFFLSAVFLLASPWIRTGMKAVGDIQYYKYAGTTLSDRIRHIGEINDRMDLWKEATYIIRDFPLFGSGLNTYAAVAPEYKSFPLGGVYPHNCYFQMAAETGLLGLGTFLWLLFTFFRAGFCYFSKMQDYLALGLLSGIFGFLIHAFFDTHLYALQMVVLFWFMMGFTVAVIKTRQAASRGNK